jgi:phospholipase C
VGLFALLGTSVAQGQTYQKPPIFNHIIIIVQENRTPDNLFGALPSQTSFPYYDNGYGAISCGNPAPFETGIDIDNGGPVNFLPPPLKPVTCSTELVDGASGNAAWNEGGGDHTHIPDWENQYDGGKIDGACYSTSNPPCNGSEGGPIFPPYSYMEQSLVQPYFDIATNYGFANYMFQTSEGPSFPAHQFLFSGTSAPTFPGDSQGYYQDFVSENSSSASNTGCPVADKHYGYPKWIEPDGITEIQDPRMPKSMCYDRNTLVTYQNSQGVHDRGVSWNYFVQAPGAIWDAPEADPQTCYTATSGSGTCGGAEFSNVIFPMLGGRSNAPIFDAISHCSLAQISWVMPDEAWSDHPDDANGMIGNKDKGLGPDWVAQIVNEIGNSGMKYGCDYWKADPTAIFITWDDWGGFYDHVPPPAVYTGTQTSCTENPPNYWGCGYVYGFRVPLLVVSEYTPAATISDHSLQLLLAGPPILLYGWRQAFRCPGAGPRWRFLWDDRVWRNWRRQSGRHGFQDHTGRQADHALQFLREWLPLHGWPGP